MERKASVRLAFTRLNQHKVYEAIVNQVEQLVVSGELKKGDTLPPERELAEQFGVSRTAVREAVKVLSEKQLVTVVHGRGVVVAHPSPDKLAASLGLLFKLGKATAIDLTEIRSFMEPEIAALAAIRATPEQVEAIEKIAAEYRMSADQPEKAVPLSFAFHRAISRAAQNEVAKAVLDSLQELLHESIHVDYYVSGAVGKAIHFQTEICRAIKERDPEAARKCMRAHLDSVMGDFKQASDNAGEATDLRPPSEVAQAGDAR